MSRLLDADLPLLVREIGQGGDLVRVVSHPGGPLEEVDFVFESMVETELFDIGKHLALGQVGEDADGLFRSLLVDDRLGVFGLFLVKHLLVLHHRGSLEFY